MAFVRSFRIQLQHPFAVGEFAAHQDAHQDVGDDAGVEGPPAVLFEYHEEGGEAAVEDEKAAPDLGNAAGVGHAFGWQARVLQAGEAFDQALFLREAEAEQQQQQAVYPYGIPIHAVRPSEKENGGEKGGHEEGNAPLAGIALHGGAGKPK